MRAVGHKLQNQTSTKFEQFRKTFNKKWKILHGNPNYTFTNKYKASIHYTTLPIFNEIYILAILFNNRNTEILSNKKQ